MGRSLTSAAFLTISLIPELPRIRDARDLLPMNNSLKYSKAPYVVTREAMDRRHFLQNDSRR